MSSDDVNDDNPEKIKKKIIQGKTTTYILSKTIGKGTFGKVKLVYDVNNLEEIYACKLLKKSNIKNKNDFIRLKRELLILTNVDHPNVIKIYEIIENSEIYFIIMEYCPKGELFNYIVENKRLSEDLSAFFFYQLINGINYLHNKGICHRDLKPENLLLSKSYQLKIIDFGLSNFEIDGALLETPCGSPCYASPEMVRGNSYDGFGIDIWSCGIILYAMICGFLPFEEGENDKFNEVLFKNIMKCDIEYPKDLISESAEDLLKQILVKNPKNRIKIEDIKKHQFYLKGQKIYRKHFLLNENNDISYVPSNNIEEKSIQLFNEFNKENNNNYKNNDEEILNYIIEDESEKVSEKKIDLELNKIDESKKTDREYKPNIFLYPNILENLNGLIIQAKKNKINNIMKKLIQKKDKLKNIDDNKQKNEVNKLEENLFEDKKNNISYNDNKSDDNNKDNINTNNKDKSIIIKEEINDDEKIKKKDFYSKAQSTIKKSSNINNLKSEQKNKSPNILNKTSTNNNFYKKNGNILNYIQKRKKMKSNLLKIQVNTNKVNKSKDLINNNINNDLYFTITSNKQKNNSKDNSVNNIKQNRNKYYDVYYAQNKIFNRKLINLSHSKINRTNKKNNHNNFLSLNTKALREQRICNKNKTKKKINNSFKNNLKYSFNSSNDKKLSYFMTFSSKDDNNNNNKIRKRYNYTYSFKNNRNNYINRSKRRNDTNIDINLKREIFNDKNLNKTINLMNTIGNKKSNSVKRKQTPKSIRQKSNKKINNTNYIYDSIKINKKQTSEFHIKNTNSNLSQKIGKRINKFRNKEININRIGNKIKEKKIKNLYTLTTSIKRCIDKIYNKNNNININYNINNSIKKISKSEKDINTKIKNTKKCRNNSKKNSINNSSLYRTVGDSKKKYNMTERNANYLNSIIKKRQYKNLDIDAIYNNREINKIIKSIKNETQKTIRNYSNSRRLNFHGRYIKKKNNK